jgi:hypothetical protein
MTRSQQIIFNAIPPGRWWRVSEIQRHAARNGRVIWPRQNLSVLLGLLAAKGGLDRAAIGNKEPIYRRAGGAA